MNEFENRVKRELSEAVDSFHTERIARQDTGRNSMPAKEGDDVGSLAGKTAQVSFPHMGYRRVIKRVTEYFGMTQQEWMLALVQAGILAAIETNEELSRIVRETSTPVWDEVTERGNNDTGTAGGMAQGFAG